MNDLFVKNFRCFSNLDAVPVKKLTLLVGENSAGKTSFLSAFRLAWDIANSPRRIDFNEEPFLLGAFDQIAHYRGGRAGRAETFEIGLTKPPPLYGPFSNSFRIDDVFEYRAEFRRSGSHPSVAKQSLAVGDVRISVSFSADDNPPVAEVAIRDSILNVPLRPPVSQLRPNPDSLIDWNSLFYLLAFEGRDGNAAPLQSLSKPDVEKVETILQSTGFNSGKRVVAIAPIRTRPHRTYNPVSDAPLPEGGHIPMVLAKIFFEDKKRWQALKSSLDRFGEASGLFNSLDIKLLGQHESDPFQIRVKLAGPKSNLIDSGYGISQVLPILVDALLANKREFFLLQQPEVHLHPRAQAELGTFLASVVATRDLRFIVETHSDFLLDRIRMEVRDNSDNPKGLKASDVEILFFERSGPDVNVHVMELDESGDLQNVPDNYRQFFLREEKRFLRG